MCREKPDGCKIWQTELSMFKGWGETREKGKVKDEDKGADIPGLIDGDSRYQPSLS